MSGTWACGWDGCPDAGLTQQAADPAAALDHHYRTHHAREPHRVDGFTPAAAWNAVDARAIASGKRRAQPATYAAARAEITRQHNRDRKDH